MSYFGPLGACWRIDPCVLETAAEQYFVGLFWRNIRRALSEGRHIRHGLTAATDDADLRNDALGAETHRSSQRSTAAGNQAREPGGQTGWRW